MKIDIEQANNQKAASLKMIWGSAMITIPTTMMAWTKTADIGGGFSLTQHPVPTPREDEVIVQTLATSMWRIPSPMEDQQIPAASTSNTPLR